MKEYKYTITVRENDPLDGSLLEVMEFSAPCLNHRWIEILKRAVDKGYRRNIYAAIQRNGKYIGSIHRYASDYTFIRGIHLNGKHYTKVSYNLDKEAL